MSIRETGVIPFSNRPPRRDGDWGIPLLRCQGAQVLQAVACASDVVGWWMHFPGKRSAPCLGEECELCLHPWKQEWTVWLPVYVPETRVRGILQLPLSADDYFARQVQLRGTCDRFQFTCNRVKGNPYGRIEIKFTDAVPMTWPAPKFPPLDEYLYRLWGFRRSNLGSSDETSLKSRLRVSATPDFLRRKQG